METFSEITSWAIFILILLGFVMWVLSVICDIICRCISVDQNPPLSEKDAEEKKKLEEEDEF